MKAEEEARKRAAAGSANSNAGWEALIKALYNQSNQSTQTTQPDRYNDWLKQQAFGTASVGDVSSLGARKQAPAAITIKAGTRPGSGFKTG
jgi:hypothetical protein